MAGVMPGQKTDDSARAVTEVTPWWAEWRTASICCHSEGGMMMWSLLSMTLSTVYRCLRNW